MVPWSYPRPFALNHLRLDAIANAAMGTNRILLLVTACFLLAGPSAIAAERVKKAKESKPPAVPKYPGIGTVERLDPQLDALIPPGAEMGKLADGFDWSEGPARMPRGSILVLPDVPRPPIYRCADAPRASMEWRP